jgi:hypothetical protein
VRIWLSGDVVDDEPAGAINAGVMRDDAGAGLGVGSNWPEPEQVISHLKFLRTRYVVTYRCFMKGSLLIGACQSGGRSMLWLSWKVIAACPARCRTHGAACR